jgi:hypothetical protein
VPAPGGNLFLEASQAAAYAANSRLGIVALLDVPYGDRVLITNISQCVTVVKRVVEGENDYPTLVVVFIFHCHHPKPSSIR